MLDFDKLPVHRDERGSLFAGMIIAAMVAFVVALIVSLLVINGLQGLKMGDKIADRFIKGHKDKIAVIYIEGPMVADKSIDDVPVACSSDIVRNIRKATDDPGVKAIVLRINSPGGTPVAAEEIISQVNRTKMKKPVVVSMGDMATSAAYFVSCSTDRIIANPDTFTGSIGVIWVFKNKTRYYDDEGINFYIAKSGNYKDVGSDWRGLSESEKTYVQDIINESYERFVRSVAKGRNLPLAEVKKIADGRVYTGSKAKELGLVDGLGGLYDAIGVASELAHIRGKPDILHMNEPKVKADQ